MVGVMDWIGLDSYSCRGSFELRVCCVWRDLRGLYVCMYVVSGGE